MQKPQKQQTQQKQNPLSWFKSYLTCHLRDGLSSLGELWRQPFSSFMILMVIAISLALPLSFLVLLNNLTQFTDNLKGQTQITLFLKMGSSVETAEKLKQQLSNKHEHEISKINLVSPEAALHELMDTLNIQDAIQALPSNPLPWVLILTLSPSLQGNLEKTKQVELLLGELQALPEVEKATLDLLWLKRLSAAIQLAEHFVTAIALLLSLAIVLVIGNTLRLFIENRREDIEVAKLIGATDAFVRRPFLYLGIWYGVIGALLAAVLVGILMYWLGSVAQQLFDFYQGRLVLQGLDLSTAFSLLALGVLLGFGAAWLSVSRHLRSLIPRY